MLSSCSLISHKHQSGLPENLNAANYLYLSGQYKTAGRIELSREAAQRALAVDPKGTVGEKARRFIKSRLPLHTVSSEAEQRNIVGVNQLMHGERSEAISTFTTLIKDYPDFEWPYANLSLAYLETNKLDSAESLLKQALAINPNYAAAWFTLSQVKEKQNQAKEAANCKSKSHLWD